MIKLHFNNFQVGTDGITTIAEINAQIKFLNNNKWIVLDEKSFSTKITLKDKDKFDLNKAYKYIRAKLERKAYNWALGKTIYQISLTKKDLEIFTDFANKAKHIVNHDDEYLSKF